MICVNPLHLDLFLRLLFWPFEWVYLHIGAAAVQALAGPLVAGLAITALVSLVASCCCFWLLVLGMVGVIQMIERRGRR